MRMISYARTISYNIKYDTSDLFKNKTRAMHLAKSRVFFLLCRKYRYAIFPESRQKYLAKWRSVALIGERHVRIEISDFVMRTFVFHIIPYSASFRSPSLTQPALRRQILISGQITAGRMTAINASPIQSMEVMPTFTPAATSFTHPV